MLAGLSHPMRRDRDRRKKIHPPVNPPLYCFHFHTVFVRTLGIYDAFGGILIVTHNARNRREILQVVVFLRMPSQCRSIVSLCDKGNTLVML